jgi:predicted enzyme related to lactoylglutathione lyase
LAATPAALDIAATLIDDARARLDTTANLIEGNRAIMRIVALLALMFSVLPAPAQTVDLPPLPAINDPATNEYLPGKFIWADLFTNNVERARRFYEQAFGWEWRAISSGEHAYGIFYNAGLAVAGVAYRAAPEGIDDYGRWVHYVSVGDVMAAGSEIVAKGGEELLGYRNHENRGEFAIYAGPHKEVFGIMRSSTGDPGDYRADFGDWIWWELFTRDVQSSIEYYQAIFDYEIFEKEDTPDFIDVYLQRHGYARAAIGPLPDESEQIPTWLGFIRVEDMTRSLENIVVHGGKVLLAPEPDVLDSDLAVIADPVGTLIALLRWDYPEGDTEELP